MGHADISTTHKIYTHLRQNKRDDVTNKLNGYFSSLDVKSDVKNPVVVDNAWLLSSSNLDTPTKKQSSQIELTPKS